MTGPLSLIALLIGANALYVAAEFSLVAISRGDFDLGPLEGSSRHRSLLATLADPLRLDRFIATCQLGITATSLIAGAVGQATLGRKFTLFLQVQAGLSEASATTLALVAVLLGLTVAQVVLGELVPKSIALQYPERSAVLTHGLIHLSSVVFRPAIALLNGAGTLLLRPFGVRPGATPHVHSSDELRLLLAESRRGGALSPEEHRLLERGLALSTRTARQMMTPQNELVALDIDMENDELLQAILKSPYSRLPVYRERLDDILGALNIKDVVARYAATGVLPPLNELIHPIPFVPDSIRAHRLARALQQQHSSKAIVVDEFGGVLGIVSLEDILSEVFGDIGDELKEAEPEAERLADGSVRLPGSFPLDELSDWFDVSWTGTAATLGGFLIDQLGRLPTEGELISLDGLRIEVREMSATSIRWLQLQVEAAAEQQDEEGE